MYVQQFVRKLEAFYEQMDREWYSDDPEWQKSHQNADAARKEQRAAKDYREKQEKAQRAQDLSTQSALEEKFAQKRWEEQENDRKAYDLSTQAMIDEKLAMRKALDSNNAVTYNKYTGEYIIATDKLPEIGKWNVTTTDGRVIVDPEVEHRFRLLSSVMSMYVTHRINDIGRFFERKFPCNWRFD